MTRPHIPIVKGNTSLQEISELVVSWYHVPSPEIVASQTENWRWEHWNAACWLTWLHGIGPLLYSRLHKSPVFSVFPGSFRNYLADQYRLNGERISILMTELSAILRMANLEGVEIAPLKGSILVYHYYEKPALRPMSDLDLLIQPSDVKKLDEILLDSGYQISEATERHRIYVLPHKSRKAVYQGEHPDNPFQIEVHTEIYEDFCGIQYHITGQIRAGCRSGTFGNKPGMLMHPADLLRHLLFHASGHIHINGSRFIQLYDIALVGSRLTSAEWKYLIQTIGSDSHILYTPLPLVKRYTGWAAPARVMEKLASETPQSLKALLGRKTISYFSYCNTFPISPSEKLRWCPDAHSLVAALLRMLLPGQIWHSFLWLLRRILGFSRYFSFSDLFLGEKSR